jgi:Stress responsive A/B Barrel Domain
MQMIRHLVLISFKPGVKDHVIQEWVALCNRIPDECPMVYNWVSSFSVEGPPDANPSTHAFCVHLDLRSKEEWAQYIKHPFPGRVYSEALKIIDLERTASVNVLVETEATHNRSYGKAIHARKIS